ncbi:MAG: hypothetical protein ACK415_02005 [Thermodesulfovibrionales bacterium]
MKILLNKLVQTSLKNSLHTIFNKSFGLITFLSLSVNLNVVSLASAEQNCPDCPRWQEIAPYGDYCPGSRRGWYGARKQVLTLREAEIILTEYFSRYGDMKVVNIQEKKRFFIAEIRDKNDSIVDIVILDKRTGRIRSIY